MEKRKRASPPGQITATFKDVLIIVAEAAGTTALIAFLCYRSVIGIVLFPVVLWINNKRYMEKKQKKYSFQFNTEFKDFLLGLNSGLQAGYSIENAIVEAGNNLNMLYGEKSVLLPGVVQLKSQMAMKIPVEKAFYELTRSFDSEELREFANLFLFAKRLGGDYAKNIRNCIVKIEDKVEVQQEINTMIAEKQLELKIMLITPAGILLYIGLASEGFIDELYHNAVGVLVMSVCIIAYFAIAYVGKKIVDIKV